MKPLLTLLIISLAMIYSLPAFAVHTASTETANSMSTLTVGELVDMNAKDLAKYTGKKLNLKERIVFKMVKGKLKRELRNGTMTAADSPAMVVQETSGGFNIVAFLLALFLSVVGFLIVLIFFDKSALTSALIGLLMSIILYGLVLI